jgi:nucleotide-binding universal stress UspA family protein
MPQFFSVFNVLQKPSVLARRLLPGQAEHTMERILVGTSPRHGALSALTRAISLAKRIEARVHVLFVAPPEGNVPSGLPDDKALAEQRRLRLLAQQAAQEGVGVESFMTEGAYEEEVIRFAREHRITLLVLESGDGDGRGAQRDDQSLKQILHGISCRVELVSPRRDETATLGNGEAT